MLNKKTIIFSIILLTGFNIFAGPKSPAWLLDVNQVYPKDTYIAQIGEGLSQEEAETNAQARIARYFESNIDTKTLNKLQMSEYEGEVSTKRSIDTSTNISSNVELFAINFSEVYKNKKEKKYYIVAYIKKDDAYMIFKPKVDLPAQNFSNYYSKAQKAKKTGDYLSTVKYLKSARTYAADFEENYGFAQLLNLKKAGDYDFIHEEVAGIDSELDFAMMECPLQIVALNDNNGALAAKAKNLFSNYGFPVKNGEGNYKVTVNASLDEETMQKGTACYPHVSVSITYNNQVVISFGKDGQKVAAVNADVARRRAYTQIENLLEEAFNEEFLSTK
ncbi:MAG: hypothetical protein K5866_03005 [Treponema sp.]|nr:hypothetical protein [Treponema sp.]